MYNSKNKFNVLLLISLCLVLSIAGICFATVQNIKDKTKNTNVDLRFENISKTNLYFEANVGQCNKEVRFISKTNNYTLYLLDSGAYMSFNENQKKNTCHPGTIIGMNLKGGNQKPEIFGLNQVMKKTNYYKGSNPNQWFTNVNNYAAVKYKNVYPGIDLVFYGKEGRLEYDFIVSPEADIKNIVLKLSSPEECRIDTKGNLILTQISSDFRFRKPVSYQLIGNQKQYIHSEFVLHGKNQVGFQVEDYNPAFPLVIDPVLVYSTYLGGTGYDNGKAIAVDDHGCAYVTGSTSSTDFPTWNAYQSNYSEGMFNNLTDIFVIKFNADGTDIIYSTYIGGRWDDSGDAIAVDEEGRVYITGRTSSNDDPETPEYEGLPLLNAFQTERGKNSSDAYLVVLDNAGMLSYASYLGGKGEDYATDIAVDDFGCAYITGTEFSYDFPVKNAFLDTKPGYYFDAFVTKMDPSKIGEASLIYSTHLGGEYDDYSNAIDVDAKGCAYVTGEAAREFPVTANALQPINNGKKDAYVTKLSSDGSFLEYSTFLGDSFSNKGLDIKVDDAGFAYVSGNAQIPLTEGAFETPYRAFLCKIDSTGNDYIYSARVGNYPKKIALDTAGNVYYNSFHGLNKGIPISRLNPEGTESTAIDTIDVRSDMALDNQFLYFVGTTDSVGLASAGAYQSTKAGSSDALVTKLSLQPEMLVVKVLSDSLLNDDVSVNNALMRIYHLDLSVKDNPLTFIESQTTDDHGLLHLSKDRYNEGMPLMFRFTPEIAPAIKRNRTEHTKHLYKVHIDNLIIDNEGKVFAQKLDNNPKDTTKVYLNHTSIAFSLITSIEWKASSQYLADLATAFQNVNNILYDVSNGQAYIDSLALFDDGSNWDNADIRIYASNLQWPCASVNGNKYDIPGASVKFPPVHHGNKADNINLLYNADPVNPNTLDHVTTIVHELGHYLLGLYDEYRDIYGNLIYPPPDSLKMNFGFMDSQYDLTDPRSSEMSDFIMGDSLFTYYQNTDQYQNFYMNSWEHFKSSFVSIYNNAVSNIHTPRDVGIPSHKVMVGPNNDLFNPDFSVGDMMGVEFNVETSVNPRRDILVVDNSGNPVTGAQTILQKSATSKTIVHGSTNSSGRIKLFDAAVGDTVLATHQNLNNWEYKKAVLGPGTALKKAGSPYQTIELKSVQTRFNMLSSLRFNESGLTMYQCQIEPSPTFPPRIKLMDKSTKTEIMPLNESNGLYTVNINKPDFSEGNVYFTALDNDGEEFFVIQDAVILDLNNRQETNFVGPKWEFFVDSALTSANQVSVLTSGFPCPHNGLADTVIRVSDVVNIGMYPTDANFSAQLQIQFYAEIHEVFNTEAIQMYKWQNGWTSLQTGVDLSNNNITAVINGPGHYAVFLDPLKNKIVTDARNVQREITEEKLVLRNYPNPFTFQTTLAYRVFKPGLVVMKIYNITGREIATLVNEYQDVGQHEITWLPEEIPAGLYIVKTEIYNSKNDLMPSKTETIKMLLLK